MNCLISAGSLPQTVLLQLFDFAKCPVVSATLTQSNNPVFSELVHEVNLTDPFSPSKSALLLLQLCAPTTIPAIIPAATGIPKPSPKPNASAFLLFLSFHLLRMW